MSHLVALRPKSSGKATDILKYRATSPVSTYFKMQEICYNVLKIIFYSSNNIDVYIVESIYQFLFDLKFNQLTF